MDKEIVISIKTIIFTFLFAIGLYILYRLGPILGLFFIALLIVFAIEPLVKKIMQVTLLNKKVSRGLAVIAAYVAFISVIVLIATIWLPPFINESEKMISNLPRIASNIQINEKLDLNLADVVPQASKISGNVLTALLAAFSNLTALLSIFIMGLYMSMDWPNIKRKFASMFPSKAEDVVLEALEEIEVSLGMWIKGESILMFIVGTACFVGLVLLDVEYPLALGLISGFLEVVPMIGPIMSAVIATIIALASTPVKAVGVIVLYIIVQQLENNLLVPKVMQKVSGFSPLIILFALLAGGEFFGLIGAVLAVPVTMIAGIVFRHVFRFMR